MTDIAIRAENLSKLYTIGRAQQRHDTTSTRLSAGLRDALVAAFQRSHVQALERSDELGALRDVSFEACPEHFDCAQYKPSRRMQRGEVVGIIGRNGAGNPRNNTRAREHPAEDPLLHHRADQRLGRDQPSGS